ncbi:MAG: isochorismatase family protein [Chlamydiia bacterium]|nr:isochorismatase family protein [Chlamydiia bacterium]
MTTPTFLKRETTGLLVIDVQDKLFGTIDHPTETVRGIATLIQGAKLLGLPIVVTEQYPEGLGSTLGALQGILPKDRFLFTKREFSAWRSPDIRAKLLERRQWLVCGIEAHVCVMQTLKDMVLGGLDPVLINDAISSQSVYDFSTAIAEMMHYARVTSTASALFELVESSASPEFKECQALIKARLKEPPSCCSIG